MVVAHIRIAPLTSMVTIDPLVLRDLIYDTAEPDDCIEHLRVRAGPHGADILAFVDSSDPEEAVDKLHRLVSQVIAHEPLLRLWRIT
ncbi:MAG TPA: hypothetical protein VFX60_17720 [Micromonospora sp.]|nr:hypothetical protein [Micromonospora sp.]